MFDLYKSLRFLDESDMPTFFIGFAVSFIAAWLAVKFFIRFLMGHTLDAFGWYRILAALGVLLILR